MAKHHYQIMTNDWKHQSNIFFDDIEVTKNFFEFKYKFHLTPVKEWTTANLIESSNEVKKGNYEFECTFIGINKYHELFSSSKLPDFIPDKIIFILPKNRKLTDFISAGFLSCYGFLVSKKAFDIISQYDIGYYKSYTIEVHHKDNVYNNYFLLVIRNELSEYIDYNKSTFYHQKGFFEYESRKLLTINSEEDYNKFTKIDGYHIQAKQFVFQTNVHPDIFTVNKFIISETFISQRLTAGLIDCTGLKILETKQIKLHNEITD